jgi:hypothetical protein
MDKESKSGFGGLSGNGIAAVVLLAAGVLFVREVPLQTTRLPVNEPRLEQRYSFQDVDARLWQDPFGAVMRARADTRKNNPDKAKADDDLRTAKWLADQVSAKGKHVEILAVMLPSGPYSENVESRRRGRYAVLAALNASRLTPVDTEHLGYFIPPAGKDPGTQSPQPIPYEWFEPASDNVSRKPSKNSLQSPVLVMWLQSEAFAKSPLKRMAELAGPFQACGVKWGVLGPNASDGLRAMIDEAAPPETYLVLSTVRFYSPYATVPDRVLLEGQSPEERTLTLSEFFFQKGVSVVRTIGDDGRLADGLIDELALRGLKARKLGESQDDDDGARYQASCQMQRQGEGASPSHIAVVAEWDTLYGRSLRREFRAKPDERGFCVGRFNYVRGLDGQLPASAGPSPADNSAKPPQPADKDTARRNDGTYIEVAEGQGQFDYLRRLAVRMREQDRRLRELSRDGQGFRAIGVLGNDVHDKLLVMQALRPEFPNAIFFTTDMDARYLHPREQLWTRNLIVASNFGLRLADGLQGGAPPFRDSYQASAFLAARLALDDARRAWQPDDQDDPAAAGPARAPQSKIAAWFTQPRIFEIGRTEAFDFKGKAPETGSRARGARCGGMEWVRCLDIHPPGSPRYPTLSEPVLFLAFGIVVLLLWAPAIACRDARAAVVRFVTRRGHGVESWLRISGLALLLVLVQVAVPLWLARHWEPMAEWITRNGKPLVLLEGISPWPTEAIRVFALLLCLYLLYRGGQALKDNLDKIGEKFEAGIVRSDLMTEQREADRKQRWWRTLFQMFAIGFIPPTRPEATADYGMTVRALDFWSRYMVQDRLSARFARTTFCVLVAILASWLLAQAVDELRYVPQRGDLSYNVHEWLRIPAIVTMYFLVFFVADATVACVRFVHGLRGLRSHPDDGGANWPATTLAKFEREIGIPQMRPVEHWIDLQFIALRTRSVTRLIYYPFIAISLWLLSRSAVFDHWTLSVSAVAPAIVGAAVALGCAVALRVSAEKSRARALEDVRNAVIRAHADPSSRAPTAKQLELLQSRIENLHEGAFAPFWQQPLLKAVLLPFATLGGTTALDYLALANI